MTTTTVKASYRTETVYRTNTEHRGHNTYADAVRWAQTAEQVNGVGNVEVRIYSTDGRWAFRGWIETRGSLR